MSERRRLWIRFRHIEAGRAGSYCEAVAEADRLAIGHGAHFWAFEADGREGLVVEFLEGPSDLALSVLDERTEEDLATAAGVPDREARPAQVSIGPEGLRCAEIQGG